MNQPPVPEQDSERKAQLMAQAARHRVNLRAARQAVAAGMHPAALTKGAVGSLALAAFALVRNRKQAQTAPMPAAAATTATVTGAAALLPLVLRGVALLARARSFQPLLRKPLIRKVLLAGAVGGVAAYAARKLLAQGRLRRQ